MDGWIYWWKMVSYPIVRSLSSTRTVSYLLYVLLCSFHLTMEFHGFIEFND
jgi:hypothetical protein